MGQNRFFITTLGCPKNQADSRSMRRSMLASGLSESDSPEEADFHLINSCGFIESAKEETIQTVLDSADIKKSVPEQKLILAGCFAERYSTAVKAEMPEVDLSFGTGLYHRVGDILKKEYGLPDGVGHDASVSVSAGSILGEALGRPYAPVKISDGCNRKCAFCAIPQFRGSFQDRPAPEIISEVQELTQAGIREVCLVSQDTNAYGQDHTKLLDLVDGLNEIQDLSWIRLLYLYPDKQTEKIIRGLAERRPSKLVPYLEAPVQHVSGSVLKAMKRAGSYEYFQDLFTMARELFPGLEIRTTFLVGFPGETPEDVALLEKFLTEVRPEKMALFAYSPEEGTSGYGLGMDASESEIAERINRVRETHLSVLKELQLQRVGQVYPVMVDEVRPDYVLARRPQDAPEVDEAVFLEEANDLKAGDILDVRITGFHEYDLTAVPAVDNEVK